MGTFITFPELLIWLPMIAGILCFIVRSPNGAKNIAFVSSLTVLGVALTSLCFRDAQYNTWNSVSYIWLKYIGNSFFVSLDGTAIILCLLTAVSFPVIFLATRNNKYERPNVFFSLMLLAQSGITGVFVAKDALLFYFFWELALIPVYFLCSIWGGEKRIRATFKFFIYTFLGSLLMLTAIIYIYMHTGGRIFSDQTVAAHSFSFQSFVYANLSIAEQSWLFLLMFAAFAVKMPVFPFHTWQPDTYDQAPTSVTMVLSGLMVKMGLFGVIAWLIPVLPKALPYYREAVMWLSVAGIIYASCLAIVQDNIKRMIAYSSIAHVGLMSAAIFAMNELSVQGVMIQMFNHGINIIGFWIVADAIEKRTGVKNISALSGIANKAPMLSIFLVIIAFANIALPLTNAFPGEFMMFAGIFKMNMLMTAVAGLSVILSAVYTLRMIKNVFYGEVNALTENFTDISAARGLALAIIVLMIFAFGLFPQHLVDLTKGATAFLNDFNALK